MPQQGTSVRERQDTHTEAPRSYRVWLLNDDFTPMDFVVEILCGLFDKAPVIAENIMMRVHRSDVPWPASTLSTWRTAKPKKPCGWRANISIPSVSR